MKRYSRILAFVLIMVLVYSSLAGCSNSKDTTAGQTSAPSQSASAEPDAKGEKVETTVLLASHVFNDTHPWQLGLKKMGELLYEKTNGKYTVDSYPAAALSGGSNRSVIEMCGTGALDFMIHGSLSMEAYDLRYGVFTLPFLFPSREVAFKTAMNSDIGRESMNWLDNYGLKGLAFCENGMRYLTMTTKLVTKPSDLKGMKVRIPESKNLIAEYEAWGATPTILNMAEVYTSMQQGVVDGSELPVPAITSNKLYEVGPNITAWNYCWDAAWLMVNKNLYNSLSAEEQKIFDECALAAADYANKLTEEQYKTDIEMYKKDGCTVYTLSDEEAKAFRDAAAVVYDDYRIRAGDKLVDDMLAAVEANS